MTGFLFSSNLEGFFAWLPALFYMAAAIADYFDGYLARRSATASGLGVALDLELDALGLLVAVSLAVSSGKLHWAFLPIGLARYGFAFLE
ncbi:MAG: CDP-alcohol phosphatidyltransferase family protein, partial [Anaerolineae bacterium]|nr:CDP-alcohol phosphatidyltransferase family protein [Anaerolineae bacterium]